MHMKSHMQTLKHLLHTSIYSSVEINDFSPMKRQENTSGRQTEKGAYQQTLSEIGNSSAPQNSFFSM